MTLVQSAQSTDRFAIRSCFHISMQDSFKQAPEGHGSTSSKLMFFCSLYLSQAKHSPEFSLELYLKLSLKPRMHKVLNRPDTDSKLSFLRLLPEPKVQSSLSADKSSHSVIFFFLCPTPYLLRMEIPERGGHIEAEVVPSETVFLTRAHRDGSPLSANTSNSYLK